MNADEKRLLARKVLHEIELFLETKPGAMENDMNLQEAVVAGLADYTPPDEEACNCDCKVCALADH